MQPAEGGSTKPGAVAFIDNDKTSTTPLARGTYTVEASFGSGATKKTATATFDVAGKVDSISVTGDLVVEVGGSGSLTATLLDTDGNPIADDTTVTFSSSSAILLTQSTGGAVGATNTTRTAGGSASMTTLGLAQGISEVFVSVGTTIASIEIQVGRAVPAVTALSVTAGSKTLLLTESTTVTATTTPVVANALIRFTEGTASASVDTSTKATDANGQASVVFVATESGAREVTAIVQQSVGGFLVDTAISGSVTITVGSGTTTISIPAGGQFIAWTGGTATASEVFGDVTIAWLWTGTAWVSFVPVLGTTNFTVDFGSVLFINVATATDIEAPAA